MILRRLLKSWKDAKKYDRVLESSRESRKSVPRDRKTSRRERESPSSKPLGCEWPYAVTFHSGILQGTWGPFPIGPV